MFDSSLFISFFTDLVRDVTPLVFIVVLVRLGFKAIVNACTGKKDLFSD